MIDRRRPGADHEPAWAPIYAALLVVVVGLGAYLLCRPPSPAQSRDSARDGPCQPATPGPAGVILNAIEDRMTSQREETARLTERVDALEDAVRPSKSGESPK